MLSDNLNARPEASPAAARGKPVVFLGPSLSHADARQILDADYRPPVRRGDLDGIAGGGIVAIVDGVFDQQLAISPTELRDALERGVRIFGASSMGALRAVEVPGVVGLGRIYEMFRDGLIDRDDEVAITFDAQSLAALCQPLVNVRHALERLSAGGTLPRPMARRILRAAQAMPYFDRVYPLILARAGLADHPDAAQLANMLAAHDLKRDDAITLLEHLRALGPGCPAEADGAQAADAEPVPPPDAPQPAAPQPNAPLHMWEFGPPLPFHALVEFLALTGGLRTVALRAAAAVGVGMDVAMDVDEAGIDGAGLQDRFDRRLAQVGRAWHWVTEEEVATSLHDLGIGEEGLQQALLAEITNEQRAMAMVRSASPAFMQALRYQLFLDDLALKRETARAASLHWLAARALREGPPPSADERAAAREVLCRQLDACDFSRAVKQLEAWGVDAARCHGFVDTLALARRAAGLKPAPATALPRWRWLPASPKVAGGRFCMPAAQAHAITKRLQRVVGVTRVAVITGLSTLGIPNAQAFRPNDQWSTTVGSGKSDTVTGARIGAVMEEVEKWAQERYSQDIERHVDCVASVEQLRRRGADVVDPLSLDLPYDSPYDPAAAMAWVRCLDLVSGKPCLLPAAAAAHSRLPQDIYYSARGARKTVTSNGLASGMVLAEALTHALCEYVERHARAMDAIVHENPGAPWAERRAMVDLARVPPSTRRLVRKIERAGYRLVARPIARDIPIPTFIATILLPDGPAERMLFGDGWQQASGWAAHPDPGIALDMAILEASQTIMSQVAGAREDLALAARSLGRHERTESRRHAWLTPEFDRDAARLPFDVVPGFVSSDAAADVRWIVRQLRTAGLERVLMLDYSNDEIAPARVVRVILPGLETINPFHTGPRARAALLSDLLGQRRMSKLDDIG
jgi:ribosomal protein S12 methylthiotransferase accessory factor